MNVERDFFPGPFGGTEYRWYATVEGKRYAYTHVIDGRERGLCDVPLEVVEREAQRAIARSIQRDLFGSRTL